MRPREPRQSVIVQAAMRGAGAWADITIRNISPHGMLIHAAAPPRPGDYIEIRKASLVLVGRAVWVKGKAFGVQLIERLNFNALLRAANESFAAKRGGGLQVVAPESVAPTLIEPAESTTTQAITWVVALGFLGLAVVCATAQAMGS